MVIHVQSPEKGRRERNRELVRRKLRESALELFRTQGYETTSVQQIADAADTAKATFFNYYLTKEHVLGEFHRTALEEILLRHRKRSYSTTRQAVVELTRIAVRVLEKEPQLTAALVRHLWGSPVLAEVDRSVGSKFGRVLRDLLQRGKQTGELRSGVDIKTASSLILSVLNGCVFDWVMDRPKFNLPGTAVKRMTLLWIAFEK